MSEFHMCACGWVSSCRCDDDWTCPKCGFSTKAATALPFRVGSVHTFTPEELGLGKSGEIPAITMRVKRVGADSITLEALRATRQGGRPARASDVRPPERAAMRASQEKP